MSANAEKYGYFIPGMSYDEKYLQEPMEKDIGSSPTQQNDE